jgi:hypothetical protein
MPLAMASGMVRSERAKDASAPRMKNRMTGERRVSMMDPVVGTKLLDICILPAQAGSIENHSVRSYFAAASIQR